MERKSLKTKDLGPKIAVISHSKGANAASTVDLWRDADQGRLLHVLDHHRPPRQALRERSLHERVEVAVEHVGGRPRSVAGA